MLVLFGPGLIGIAWLFSLSLSLCRFVMQCIVPATASEKVTHDRSSSDNDWHSNTQQLS